MRTTIAGTRFSGRLSAAGCAALTVLASVSLSACSGGTPSATPPSLSPGGSASGSGSPTPTDTSSGGTASPSDTASASPSDTASATPSQSPTPTPTPTPTPSSSPYPTAAPATGGGGTAGFQDTLLLSLGGAAILAGAGSIVYRRKVVRTR